MKNNIKTAEDYRKDRDWWKRRALKQQNVIDTINRHNDRLTNDRDACKSSSDYFRQALKEVCPHDKLSEENTLVWEGRKYCDRCKCFVETEDLE